MRKLMYFSMLVAFTFASIGCASGAPAVIDRSGASAPQAVVPVNRLGFQPEVQAVLGMPIDVTDCVIDTGTNIVKDLVQGARCVLNKIVPIVTEQPQSAPQYVEVEETYMEAETTTRMVPRTRSVKKQLVPVQSAPCAPSAPQYAPTPPAPQRVPGCEPVATGSNCSNGSCALTR